MTSKRHLRRRRCGTKKRYHSETHAASDAATLTRQGRKPLQAYRCPHCGGIHVGHVPRRLPPSPALQADAA